MMPPVTLADIFRDRAINIRVWCRKHKIARSTLYEALSGHCVPHVWTVEKIAKALRVPRKVVEDACSTHRRR